MAKSHAFTLIEIAIVLALIGLLVGGVFAGASLVKGTRINAQVAQFKKIENAFNLFRLTYGAFPGDMSNASRFWSTATGGNGNRLIDDAGSNACAGGCGQIHNNGEKSSFFHHLSIAEMVPETYISPYAASNAYIGVSVPQLFLYPSSHFMVAASMWYTSTSFGMDRVNPNAPTKGIYLFAASNSYGVYAFNPPEAAQIDRKMDDGYPTSGRLWGVWNNSCITATTPALYRSDTTKGFSSGCGLQYVLQK